MATKVKPAPLDTKKCRLILKGVPIKTTEEEIKHVFTKCKSVKFLKKGENNIGVKI